MDRCDVIKRETQARYFIKGWDRMLERKGILLYIYHLDPPVKILLVDSEAAAAALGSRSGGTVEKYLEIMRGLRYIPAQYRHIPQLYGFLAIQHRPREPVPPTPEPSSPPSFEDDDDVHCTCDHLFDLPEVVEPEWMKF